MKIADLYLSLLAETGEEVGLCLDLYSQFVQGSNLTGYSYGLVRLPFVLVLRKTDRSRIFTCVWICTDFLYKVHLQKGYSNSLVQLSFVLELRKTNKRREFTYHIIL